MRRVGERGPTLEFFVGIMELDGYKCVRLLDADRSTLIQALNLIYYYTDRQQSRVALGPGVLTKGCPEDASPNFQILVGEFARASEIYCVYMHTEVNHHAKGEASIQPRSTAFVAEREERVGHDQQCLNRGDFTLV